MIGKTPKEKAEQLIKKIKDSFDLFPVIVNEATLHNIATKYAVLFCEEIMEIEYIGSANYNFYEKVKQEIQKL